MKPNFIVGFTLAILIAFVCAFVARGVETDSGTPIPSIPFISLEHNGEEGFWMNLETAKQVAWAVSMIPVYIETLEEAEIASEDLEKALDCLLYTSPSPRDRQRSRMPSSA